MADKDSEAKRRGGLATAWVLPKPDGTIAQGDRQHKVTKYPGILSTVNYPTGTLGGKPSPQTDFVIPRVPRGLPPGATTRLRRGTQHLQNSNWSFLGENASAEDTDLLLLRDVSNNTFKRISKADFGVSPASGGFTPGDSGDDGTESDNRLQYIEVNNPSGLNTAINTQWDPDDEATGTPGKMTIWCMNQTTGGSVTFLIGANCIREDTSYFSQFVLTNEGDMLFMVTTLSGGKMIWTVCEKNGAVLS